MSDKLQSERPHEPEFRAAQPARMVLDFTENDECVHEADIGWARIDGQWVHWWSDQQGFWQTWPMSAVVVIEWTEENGDAPAF